MCSTDRARTHFACYNYSRCSLLFDALFSLPPPTRWWCDADACAVLALAHSNESISLSSSLLWIWHWTLTVLAYSHLQMHASIASVAPCRPCSNTHLAAHRELRRTPQPDLLINRVACWASIPQVCSDPYCRRCTCACIYAKYCNAAKRCANKTHECTRFN